MIKLNKKNGFIAVSIIFSFFILFLLLVALNISRYYQNGILNKQTKKDILGIIDKSFNNKTEVINLNAVTASTSADISFTIKNIKESDNISFCYSNIKENIFTKNSLTESLIADNCLEVSKKQNENYSLSFNNLSINTNYYAHVRINNNPASKVLNFKTLDLSSVNDVTAISKKFKFVSLGISYDKYDFNNKNFDLQKLSALNFDYNKCVNSGKSISCYNNVVREYPFIAYLKSINFGYFLQGNGENDNEIRNVTCQYILPDGKMSFTGEYIGDFGTNFYGSCVFNTLFPPLAYNKINETGNNQFDNYGTFYINFYDQFGNKYEEIYKNKMLNLTEESKQMTSKKIYICRLENNSNYNNVNPNNPLVLDYNYPKYSSKISLSNTSDNEIYSIVAIIKKNDNYNYDNKYQYIYKYNNPLTSIESPYIAYATSNGRLSNILINKASNNNRRDDTNNLTVKKMYFDDFNIEPAASFSFERLITENNNNEHLEFENPNGSIEEVLNGMEIEASITSSIPIIANNDLILNVGQVSYKKYDYATRKNIEVTLPLYKLKGKIEQVTTKTNYRKCYTLQKIDNNSNNLRYISKIIFTFDHNSFDEQTINAIRNKDYSSNFYNSLKSGNIKNARQSFYSNLSQNKNFSYNFILENDLNNSSFALKKEW